LDISVILCTYNRCQSLALALENLARQLMPDSVTWEILVVDNNSTDNTRRVVEEFSGKCPERFRYVRETQQGKSYALNTGIRSAKGKIMAFADDDATVEPAWLWNLTSQLQSGEWAGAGGRIVPVWRKPVPRWLSIDDPDTMGPFVAFDAGTEAGQLNRPPYGANMAFRRDAFEKYGGFRTDLGPRPGSEIRRDDIEFANRLLAAGERLRYEPNAVVHHPAPEERMTQRFVLRWWYWYGYGEVADFGSPSVGGWQFRGVPLFLFRRLARWAAQWVISTRPAQRFACKRKVWYLAGIISACRQTRYRDSTAAEIPEVSRTQQEYLTRQSGSP
jgi:glycosyltransferase involved in cell wall biosynthesis